MSFDAVSFTFLRGRRRSRRRTFLAAVRTCALLLGAARLALAQTPATTDTALAQALFNDAKALMASGAMAAACPKFAESYRLDPAQGTLMGLALCHEGLGKNATAWAEFLVVMREAKKSGRADREMFAQEHVAKLEPTLAHLTIVVPEASPPAGFEVRRDGVAITPAVWGTAIPVDPGAHVIEAIAPSKTSWRREVQVGTGAANVSVSVPTLVDATDATAPETAEPSPPTTRHTPSTAFPTAAAVVGGVGVLALGAGSYFGVRALSENSESRADCSPSQCHDAASVATSQDAVRDAWVADVSIGIGVVGLAAGVYLFLRSNAQSHPSEVTLLPQVGPGRGGMALGATW